ncbi:alpha/beta fold hydrolase [Kineosporia sp. NBRC 101731]|uniref:alpha/beta fold hydrolase n=1 Tax=Kineosporia sp. NBRC 101731 TaxID=3032199 RepID=UPI0024A04067|nr:alpha/beta fold hydrolase [Kineosporia sp. NBRC 101731]GLY32399.1 alpha/beta hydrolase [Kineosporia sp. NBRC 101731]
MRRYTRTGLSFDVRDSGPDNGIPVILLHGFPQTSTCWLKVEPLLHSAGIRTIAPDQRGYSPAARPLQRRRYATTELMDDVLALLDAVGHRSAHLVGHDWGGALAWALAGQHPDRFRSVTVLSTPHPAAMGKALRSGSQAAKSWYMGAFQLPLLPEAAVRNPRFEQTLIRSGLPQTFAQRDARRLRQPHAATGAVNWYRGIAYSRDTPAGRAKLPVTYVWGAQDAFLGRAAAEATADFIDANHRNEYRFVELDAGHWLPETNPDQVAQAVIGRVNEAEGTRRPHRTNPLHPNP